MPEEGASNAHSDLDGLLIKDQASFLAGIPDLVARFRMRLLENAWRLNLSRASLAVVDEMIAAEIDRRNALGPGHAGAIDRGLLLEITAYVGEVIRHTSRARWCVTADTQDWGPTMVVTQIVDDKPFRKGIDLCYEMFVLMSEGTSIVTWYGAEVVEGGPEIESPG